MTIVWRLLHGLALVGLVAAAWYLLQHTSYRIDIDVYRMGGRAWLDGTPLYSNGTLFHTWEGSDLPFTYPPLAAVVFSPFAWLSLPAASATITVLTLILLVAAVAIVLHRLDLWPGRHLLLAAAIVAPATVALEPIRSNFNLGQINVVLMALVIADCVPRRTPWPRGLLLGLAIALKLTPAVFLLYLLLRRDGRAVLTAVVSFLAATAAGFVLAAHDSVQYWTSTVRNTDRIGAATYNTNQNIAGALARLGLGEETRFLVWTAACVAVLGVTIWAARRAVAAGEPTLALMCVALFGLVVSPVSWSHHWVWALPTVLVTGVLAYRRRSASLTILTAAGVLMMVFVPFELMPQHHEPTAALWRQLAGLSYVWWALAVVTFSGFAVRAKATEQPPVAVGAPPVPIG